MRTYTQNLTSDGGTTTCAFVLRPETVLFNFSILQTLSHMTHGEHRIVSGDSPTILSRDSA